ncbi:LacI family DNA-binding transcriptional regulator [Rhizobium johnstonii]|uniref:LacI family DNA-binding transcriptional regulator n=1 Tax=Rhizobium TaxID=379 RepID=UPI0013EF4D07|nr:LacI family DNA-binding transcriptional regulator [Rhizobium leguminosarum]
MTTIKDVAQAAGVSTSTVSLTFASPDRVSPGTAERIWKAADALGYRPNPLAQNLKRGRSRMIGVLVGDISSPFFGRFLKVVEKRVWERDYLMIVADTDGDPARELDLLEQFDSQRIAGILLSPHGGGVEYGQRLGSFQTPIVTVDHRSREAALDYVGSDSRMAARMLTDHMINMGHRRIAQITGPIQLYTASERLQGYLEAYHAAGMHVDDSLIVDGRYQDTESYAQTMRLMTRPDRPTAVLAASNMMALGALQAIQELGYSCPRDVSLATIDDIPWSSVIKPRLTTVLQDIETIAKISADYLLDRIETLGSKKIPARETILMPRLSLGTSTTPPQLDVVQTE